MFLATFDGQPPGAAWRVERASGRFIGNHLYRAHQADATHVADQPVLGKLPQPLLEHGRHRRDVLDHAAFLCFDNTMKSGVMSKVWQPNIRPVRPKPVMTLSAISRMLYFRQTACIFGQ